MELGTCASFSFNLTSVYSKISILLYIACVIFFLIIIIIFFIYNSLHYPSIRSGYKHTNAHTHEKYGNQLKMAAI